MEHPYLFFSKRDIPALKERFKKEPFLTRWNLMVSDADEILDKEMIDSTKPIAPPNDSADRFSYRNASACAFVYAITGEKKYAERAIAEVLHNFELDVKTYWQYNSVNCTGAGLGTSNYSLACGLVYDWCYDAMTEETRQKFRDGFNNIVNDLYMKSLNHPDNREASDWWVYRDHSNWSSVCHGAQGVAALAFYDEFEKARRSVIHAERHIERFFRNNLEIDGGCAEGVMYARYGLEYALYFFVAHTRMFGLNRIKRDTLKLINDCLTGYWDLYMLAPDLGYANFGNIDEYGMRAFWSPQERHKEGPSGTQLALFDSILPDGDPLLRWGTDVGSGGFFVWQGACPFHLLWRKDEKPPCKQLPVKLQDSVFFRQTGQALFNSGKLWLAFNGGLVSPDSHFNRDLGSFILISDKERLTNDPGYGDSETRHHSTLLVGGYGQIKGGYGKFLCFDKGENFYALSCDLTHAYDPLSKLDKFIRHMIVVDDKYVFMLDELQADEPVTFEWMLQATNPVVLENNSIYVSGKTQKLHIVMADTEQPVETELRPWNRVQRGKDQTINMLHIQPKEKSMTHTFATVLFPSTGELAPTLTLDGTEIRISFGDKTDCIEFSRELRGLKLQTVNGKPLSGLQNPYDRSVVPFRDTNNHETDETKMPPWIFGTYSK